jgi:DNA-binding Lrp family transcriptional regulator
MADVAPDLLTRIAARYRGQGLGEADGDRLVVQVIAADFGVHPNSIYIWAKRFRWRRPAWYVVRRPIRKRHGTAARDRADLLAAITTCAASCAPCPSNVEFARRIGASVTTVSAQLRALRRAGAVASEHSGPCRRLVLRDGRTTGFTRLARTRAPHLFHVAAERRSRPDFDDRLERLLRALAAEGRPVPGNAVIGEAIGCAPSTVRRVVSRRVRAGAFGLELRGNERRVGFPDGPCTPWLKQLAGPVVDYAVGGAVRSLRQQGVVVYDLAVATGRAWGVAWFLDGRTVGRDDLLAVAAGRQARALEQLRAAA